MTEPRTDENPLLAPGELPAFDAVFTCCCCYGAYSIAVSPTISGRIILAAPLAPCTILSGCCKPRSLLILVGVYNSLCLRLSLSLLGLVS